jgi:AraC-like DNA-binding protein
MAFDLLLDLDVGREILLSLDSNMLFSLVEAWMRFRTRKIEQIPPIGWRLAIYDDALLKSVTRFDGNMIVSLADFFIGENARTSERDSFGGVLGMFIFLRIVATSAREIDLAREVGRSASYISRVFRAVYCEGLRQGCSVPI